MSKQKKKTVRVVYMNPVQKKFFLARQKRKTMNCGRGLGKSYMIGHHNYLKFRNMPKAKSLLLANTFYQLLTKTAPQMEQAFGDWGLREYDPKTKDGHWVFGKKPPAHFEKPHSGPKNFEYCYTFINGYTIELASAETKDRIRGGSYDALDADESATLKEADWNKIMTPSVRGINRGPKNIDSYLRYSICDFTSAPWLMEGNWIYHTEQLAKDQPDKYFFLKAATHDNVEILGQAYLDHLRATLSPLEYFVEVLNGRLKRQADGGFYPGFNDDKHIRNNSFEYDWTGEGRMTIKRDTFIDPSKELIFSLDFNVKFTSGLVAQEQFFPQYRELRFCDALFEKPDPTKDLGKESELLIDRIVDNFCKKYAFHPVKYIEIDGDNSAKNLRVGAAPMFEQVASKFRLNGWQPVVKAIGKLPLHQSRYLLINNILRQSEARYPRIAIHGTNCKNLIMSIQNAGVKGDFQKDKSSELKDIDQSIATHFSDCFDYVIFRKYGDLLLNGSSTIWASTMPSFIGR
jgi:hypothetical protein